MCREDDACTAVNAGQLLYSDGVAEGIEACAAILFGEGDAHETHLAKLGDGLGGEFVLLIQHERNGFYFFFRESADLSAQLLMSRCGLKQHSFLLLASIVILFNIFYS